MQANGSMLAAVPLIIFHDRLMLLQRDVLTTRWDELLSAATKLDVAVAWITSEQRVAQLLEFVHIPGRRLRVITGVHDYLTSATALRRLYEIEALRVAIPEKGCKFHPKLYIFTTGEARKCWVGSANLTGAAFDGNVELVCEYDDDGAASEWFNRHWALWLAPNAEWLDLYEKRVNRCGQAKPSLPQMLPPVATEPLVPMGAPSEVSFANPFGSWAAYFHALRATDTESMTKTQGNTGIYSGET